jgi:hypothetical protein
MIIWYLNVFGGIRKSSPWTWRSTTGVPSASDPFEWKITMRSIKIVSNRIGFRCANFILVTHLNLERVIRIRVFQAGDEVWRLF